MSTKQIQKSIELLQELVDSKSPILYSMLTSEKTHDITEIVAKKYSGEFIKLVNDFSKQNTIEQCIKLFNYVGVEPLKFIDLSISKQKLKIDLINRPIEEIQCFLDYAKTKVDGYKIKYPFKFIEEVTYNHAFHLLSVWSDEETKDMDKFKLLWITEQNYLKNQLIENEKLSYDSKLDTIEILKRIQIDPGIPNRQWYRIQYHYFEEKDIKNFIDMGFYLELEHDLSNGTGKQQKKVKP